ncbi:hypothetical protein D3C71_1629220 [compost metagenome]
MKGCSVLCQENRIPNGRPLMPASSGTPSSRALSSVRTICFHTSGAASVCCRLNSTGRRLWRASCSSQGISPSMAGWLAVIWNTPWPTSPMTEPSALISSPVAKVPGGYLRSSYLCRKVRDVENPTAPACRAARTTSRMASRSAGEASSWWMARSPMT